jgi:UDP-3-O-[3-hydroxymyristoyl] glucosamine N-acyltransferase
MSFSLTITELAKITAASAIEGSRSTAIKAIASLAEAGPDDLSFLGNPKYSGAVATSKAGVILVPQDFSGQPSSQQVFLRVDKPSYASSFNLFCTRGTTLASACEWNSSLRGDCKKC